MSLERGGRADKYGNEYENQQLAKLFLRLANEKLASIIVEPIDETSDAYEYVTESSDGILVYYQCKSSNGEMNSWTVDSLQRYHIFDRIKALLLTHSNAQYHFISPLSYKELDEICKRARTCNDPTHFQANVTTNKTIKKSYEDAKQILDVDNTVLISILSRCFFEQIPFTETETTQLEDLIDLSFTGDAHSARILLENYANGSGKYGIKITAKDIVDYMAQSGHQLRNNIHDERLLQKINSLNTNHWNNLPGINNKFLHRDITDIAIQEIQNGHSLIIHGKAGAGKSGCLQEIRNYLSDNNILYLSVKLDKHTPEGTADQYGKSLDLPESPVYSLLKLSAGNACVLILDQLDSLRWTNNHSKTSLDVCKELIFQANAANRYQGAKIIIVFATRTFDLEYDPGLRQLFDSKKTDGIIWKKIHVDYFTKSEVIQLIGQEYTNFPSKLQRLLCIPSSLYIWSQLLPDHRQTHISSVRELVLKWWDQILQTCTRAGIDRRDAKNCRDKIVSYMESTSTLFVLRRLFIDDENIIDMFISCGMLQEQNDYISFVHQSFWDQFVCTNIIDQIIQSGKNLPELIGTYENQTPIIRYRLQTILQELLDTNISLFISQASLVMQSNTVHDYLKCCVFELIGQYEEPNDAIYDFIETYIQSIKWEEFIYQTVYYSHPVHIKHYSSSHTVNWLEGKPSIMLQSITDKDSEFAALVLKPYINVSIEDDKRVYQLLPNDIAHEAEQSYQLRLYLLTKYPELMNGYFLFHDMFVKQSIRALDFITIIMNNHDTLTIRDTYFEKDKALTQYIHIFYKEIINRLFPLICEKTKEYLPHWFGRHYMPEYKEWMYSGYNETFFRNVVEIVKNALCELAQRNSDEFCALLNSISYPFSGVGHELIMSALCKLPEAYSDYCIEWLLSDFNGRIFVFSADLSDYLKLAKQLIDKHTCNCSDDLFKRLEETIYYWHDSKEWIKSVLIGKREFKESGHGTSYCGYWGHLQKILFHHMDYDRLSNKAKNLIDVLDRNQWISISHFYFISSMGPAKFVVSPIEGRTDKLSNKHWLKIISTPLQKMDAYMRGTETDTNYIESSPFAFASALGTQAKNEPLRFARLSLQFPVDCYSGYVSHIIYALEKNSAAENDIPEELVFQVIRKYMYSESTDISFAILRVIQNRSVCNWPDDILEFVKQTALYHSNPDPKDPQWTKEDPARISMESLANWSYNCIRGSAIYTIGSLLWDHKELESFFRPTILTASTDIHAAVRLSVMSCVVPYFNIDKKFSEQIYKQLIDQDLRILVSRESWKILFFFINNDYEWYCEKIEDALISPVEDLPTEMAGLYCAIAIYRHDDSMLHKLLQHPLSDKQQDTIIRNSAELLPHLQYHEMCKIVISNIINQTTKDLHGLSMLFYHDRISVEKDAAFLIDVFKHSQGSHIMHSFLHFVKESDNDLRLFAPLFQTISNEISQNPEQWNNMYWLDDFIECTIHLFDQAGNDLQIRSLCLDIWDKLYISNLQGLKSISSIMEECET